MAASHLRDFFWRRVKKTSDCWLWTGSTSSTGYGLIRMERGNLRAHRFAWELYYGPIPNGLCVLHICDVRHCVCPRHLFIGTRPENSSDMVAKGRQLCGETHNMVKLSESSVLEIRASEEPHFVLANRYGVSRKTIHGIRTRDIWRRLRPDLPIVAHRDGRPHGSAHPRTKLTEDDVRSILASTDTHKCIAERYAVSESAIYNIRARRCWKHLVDPYSTAEIH